MVREYSYGSICLFLIVVPERPSQLVFVPPNTLTWAPPPATPLSNVAYYIIAILDDTSSDAVVKQYNATGSNTQLSGLAVQFRYRAQVRAVNSQGDMSPWSERVLFIFGVDLDKSECGMFVHTYV